MAASLSVEAPDVRFGLQLYDEPGDMLGGASFTRSSSGRSADESPAQSGRRVMLRRPLGSMSPPSPTTPESRPATGKPVLLAHRVQPGKTIQLKSSPTKATISMGSPLVTQPESVAMSGKQGPRYAASGVVPYSLIGSPQACAC